MEVAILLNRKLGECYFASLWIFPCFEGKLEMRLKQNSYVRKILDDPTRCAKSDHRFPTTPFGVRGARGGCIRYLGRASLFAPHWHTVNLLPSFGYIAGDVHTLCGAWPIGVYICSMFVSLRRIYMDKYHASYHFVERKKTEAAEDKVLPRTWCGHVYNFVGTKNVLGTSPSCLPRDSFACMYTICILSWNAYIRTSIFTFKLPPWIGADLLKCLYKSEGK